jgi:recombination protein RecA
MAKSKTGKDPITAYRDHMSGSKTMELMSMVDDESWSTVPGYISTQSIGMNKVLGAPGYPMGRVVEISGLEHSGKSTVLDHAFSEVQSMGGVAILLDPEVGRDSKYSRSIGVDVSTIQCPQPKTGGYFSIQSAFNYIGSTIDFFKTDFPDTPLVIGIDSLAGMPTEEDLERDAGAAKPGDAAKTIRHALRNIVQRLARTKIVLISVNQLYSRIGVTFGSPYTESGGKGMAYHASLRLRLSKKGTIKDRSGAIAGQITEVKVNTTKISGKTGAEVDIGILHGRGIDNTYTLFETLKEHKFIVQKGAWAELIHPTTGEVIKFQGQHWGMADLFGKDDKLYPQLVEVYYTL